MHRLSDAHPGLNVQLLAGSSIYSLSKRDADIVIALSAPPSGRVVAKRLTDYELGLYASKQYLERCGAIARKSELDGHKFIGYIGDLIQMPELDYAHQVSTGAVTSLESSNLVVQVKATLAGAGLCVLPAFIAQVEPELVAVLPGAFRLTRSFWMIVHEDHKDLARVRLAARFIVDEVRKAKRLFRLPASNEHTSLATP